VFLEQHFELEEGLDSFAGRGSAPIYEGGGGFLNGRVNL
jgi:hypothetical protein